MTEEMCWESCPNRYRLAVSGLAPDEHAAQVARMLLWMLATGTVSSPHTLLVQAFEAGFDAGVVYRQDGVA